MKKLGNNGSVSNFFLLWLLFGGVTVAGFGEAIRNGEGKPCIIQKKYLRAAFNRENNNLRFEYNKERENMINKYRESEQSSINKPMWYRRILTNRYNNNMKRLANDHNDKQNQLHNIYIKYRDYIKSRCKG